MSPTPDGFDAGCVEDPRIVKFDDLFYVTYAYRPFPPGQYWLKKSFDHGWPKSSHWPKGLLYNTTNTGLAISKDLKTFKKLGRMTKHSVDNRDVILFPEKVNGKYVMLHRPVEWVGPEYGCEVPSIWLAFSDDLMEWKDDFMLATSIFDWESKKLGGSTPPLRTKDGWLVIYHGVSKKDEQYRVGVMLLDINDPRKILARSSDYIMEPEFLTKLKGIIQDVCFQREISSKMTHSMFIMVVQTDLFV
jgi:beta-1,2-mannobiose phosphorylase / 1,2-beta-oligomannan phosphorylase